MMRSLSLFFLMLLYSHLSSAQSVIPGKLYVKYAHELRGKDALNTLQNIAISEAPAFKLNEQRLRAKGTTLTSVQALRSIMEWTYDTSTISLDEILSVLNAHPAIAYAEPVFELEVFANDTQFTSGNQSYLHLIRAPQAWTIVTGSRDVVIAIVDTGTDYLHPDLAANVWINPGEEANTGQDNDGNGFIDDVHGWDFFNGTPIPLPGSASNQHGTHVAGIAAAVTNNGLGVASLSHNVSFMPLKASDNNGKNFLYAWDAVIYAWENGAHIINCSWGTTGFSRAIAELMKTIAEDDVLIVAAAGNDGSNRMYYPAAYPDVLAVGSIDPLTSNKSSFSNFGPFVDVAAPGTSIMSTLNESSYGTSSGTSMAAPVVSALAALIKSAHPEWSASQIRAQIMSTTSAHAFSDVSLRSLLGTGLINAEAALGSALPGIRLVSAQFNDSPANGDGVFTPGEVIQAVLTFKNFGITATSVEGSFTGISAFIQPQQANFSLGSLNTGETKVITLNALIRPDTPINHRAFMRFDLQADGDYATFSTAQVDVAPSLITHSSNSIELSVGGSGRIGFQNYPTNTLGSGFIIKQTGTSALPEALLNTPLLREAGLFYGNHESAIMAAIRSTDNTVSNDFLLRDYFVLTVDNSLQAEVSSVSFTDINGGGARYDITTQMNTYVPLKSTPTQHMVINVHMHNTSSGGIGNLGVGLFFDFDLPISTPGNDMAFYDASTGILGMYDNSAGNRAQALHVGVKIIGGIHSPWIINNNAFSSDFYFGFAKNNASQEPQGFTNRNRWLSLFGREAAIAPGRELVGPGNMSFVAAATPFSLQANESKTVQYVLAYGENYEQLKEELQAAEAFAAQVPVSIDSDPSSEIPEQFGIIAAYPNPFNPSTTIRYSLLQSEDVTLTITDILGRTVFTQAMGVQHRGEHSVSLQLGKVASGMYFAQLKTNNLRSKGYKLMLLK